MGEPRTKANFMMNSGNSSQKKFFSFIADKSVILTHKLMRVISVKVKLVLLSLFLLL